MGTLDGPGIRLVVFLQGCNFKCLFCANPDTIKIGEGGSMVPDEEIVRMAVNEKPYFGRRGGVTFSGGDPLVQARELIPLCRKLKAEGINICVDTNGSIYNEYTSELFDLVDMVLLDCKEINPKRHRVITGRGNENVLRTMDLLYEKGVAVRLRHVLVPGYSNFDEDLIAMAEHFGKYDNIERLEILPYHTLGVHKYENLGWKYPLEGVETPPKEEVERVVEMMKPYFKLVWHQ